MINIGGTSVRAVGGVVAESHGRQHHKVMLEQVSNADGRVVNLLPLINPQNIFAAIQRAGIVFSGPAPFDAEGKCMRFMFAADAEAFYEAFKAE